MSRQRLRQQVRYGKFREYMEIADEVITLRRKLGLAAPVLWAPVVGTANEIVWEIDYADLATFQREDDAFHADADAMKQWRRSGSLRYRAPHRMNCCSKRHGSRRHRRAA